MERRQFLKDAAMVTVTFAQGQAWRASAQTLPEIGAGPAFEPWKLPVLSLKLVPLFALDVLLYRI